LTTIIGKSELNSCDFIEIQLKLFYLQKYTSLMGVRSHVPFGHETRKYPWVNDSSPKQRHVCSFHSMLSRIMKLVYILTSKHIFNFYEHLLDGNV